MLLTVRFNSGTGKETRKSHNFSQFFRTSQKFSQFFTTFHNFKQQTEPTRLSVTPVAVFDRISVLPLPRRGVVLHMGVHSQPPAGALVTERHVDEALFDAAKRVSE